MERNTPKPADSENNRTRTGKRRMYMPVRPFMWTPDQVAQMLEVEEAYVRSHVLWYNGREPGLKPRDKMKAVNIAAHGETPIWRIAEDEIIKWLRIKGITIYERGYVE